MKRTVLILLTFVFVLMLGTSVLTVGATDIYPDLLETIFEDGCAYNMATGSDIEPEKDINTVWDETAEAYFLRASKDDPENYLVSTEATNALARMILVQKQSEPDLDLSFAWEFMVRLPEMPESMTYGSGYFASGGFTFCADANYGYFLVQSATSDADAQNLYLQFPMQANKWYHCMLIYDDFEQQFYAYVNGERIKAMGSNDDYVSVNPFRLSYLWHHGLQIGGSNIEYKRVDLSQDIAICNIYSQIVPEEDYLEIYEYTATTWGLIPKEQPTNAPVTEAPATEAPATETEGLTTEVPVTDAPAAETEAPVTDAPENGGNGGNGGGINGIIIIAIIAAVVVIGGAAAAFFVIKKK